MQTCEAVVGYDRGKRAPSRPPGRVDGKQPCADRAAFEKGQTRPEPPIVARNPGPRRRNLQTSGRIDGICRPAGSAVDQAGRRRTRCRHRDTAGRLPYDGIAGIERPDLPPSSRSMTSRRHPRAKSRLKAPGDGHSRVGAGIRTHHDLNMTCRGILAEQFLQTVGQIFFFVARGDDDTERFLPGGSVTRRLH